MSVFPTVSLPVGFEREKGSQRALFHLLNSSDTKSFTFFSESEFLRLLDNLGFILAEA